MWTNCLRAHRRQTEEIVREILQEGIAEGAFRPDLDPEADAAFILEVLTPQADQVETRDVARLAGATVRFVLAAVRAP